MVPSALQSKTCWNGLAIITRMLFWEHPCFCILAFSGRSEERGRNLILTGEKQEALVNKIVRDDLFIPFIEKRMGML